LAGGLSDSALLICVTISEVSVVEESCSNSLSTSNVACVLEVIKVVFIRSARESFLSGGIS
jgi:hypothetical protein